MAQHRTKPAPPEQQAAVAAAAAAILELDPALIAPSFIADRMETTDESYRSLVASIAAQGQLVPILVRPHPDESGLYQVACGHRRLRAAAELGRPIRCMVKPLSDRELVIAQGQENSARATLSFIERARFAQALEQRHYRRDVIMQALSTDKGTVSRLLLVCRRLPTDVIEALGPAPAFGRERWMKLAAAFARHAAERPIDPLLEAASFTEAASDQRFAMLYRHLTGKTPLPQPAAARGSHALRFGLSAATATVTDRAFTLRLDRAIGRGFGEFLVTRLEGLYEDYALARRRRTGETHHARHSLGR